MKIRHLALLCIIATLAAFGAIAAACSDDNGGDELTLEQYMQRVQELDDQFEEDGNALDDRFNDLTVDSPVDDARDLFDEQIDIVEGFVDGLDDLNPPPEAQDVHDEAVSAGRDVVQAFRDALDEASDAETIDDFGAIFLADELDATFERFDQACFDAQALADDNGIDVSFNCGE